MLPMHVQRGPSNHTRQENLALLLDNQITFGSLVVREVRRVPLTKKQKVEAQWKFRGESLPIQILYLADQTGLFRSRLGQIIAEQCPQKPTNGEVAAIATVLGYGADDIQRLIGHVCNAPTPEPEWRERARSKTGSSRRRRRNTTTQAAVHPNGSSVGVAVNTDSNQELLSAAADNSPDLLRQGSIDTPRFYHRRREYLELSRYQVATETGIPEEVLEQLERNPGYRISYPRLKGLAEVLGIPVKDLLGAHKRQAQAV